MKSIIHANYEEFGLKLKKPYHHPYHTTTSSPVVVTTTVGHGTIHFKHDSTPRPPWDHEIIHSTPAPPWDGNGAYGVPDEDIGPDEYDDYSYNHHSTPVPHYHSTTFTTARPHFHHSTVATPSPFLHRTPIPDFEKFHTDITIPEDSYGLPEEGPIYRDEAETMKPVCR